MAMYYNGQKVRNLYYNGKCITRLALGKEMTRLVEGDDFVRAEWLKTTGYAYINTKVRGNQNSEIDVIAIQRTNPTVYAITLYGSVPNNANSSISFNVSTIASGRNTRFGNRVLWLADYKLNEEYSVFQSKDVLSINGIVVSNIQASNTFESGEIYLFSSNITDDISPYLDRELWIKRFTIRNVIDLTPCRLLRPIPATLDANGIARNAGECGMFDAVSGKFFGNVAASGAFTVEPSLVEDVDYEVHKWLVGDGSAYIDTLINKLEGTITVDIDRTAVTSNSNIFGREAYPGLGYESRCVVNLLNNNVADIYGIRTTSGYGVNIDMVDTLYLDLDTKIASTKSGNSTSIDIGTDIGGYNMLLFAKNNGSTPLYCWRGGIGEFKMADVISLTPVRLLRPLPSYLDANGKARHQFECGMLDLKTMKFYGNVATSGNFTVSDN